MLAELALVCTQLTFVRFYSSDVDALVAEIMAKEPLVTRSKAGQVKGLIESEFADMCTLETAIKDLVVYLRAIYKYPTSPCSSRKSPEIERCP